MISKIVSISTLIYVFDLYFVTVTMWITVSVENTIDLKTIGFAVVIIVFLGICYINEEVKEKVCEKL